MTAKKRFVAGAVCPQCSQMDKIVTYHDHEKKYRECVNCGFKDEIWFEPPAREVDTRVNKSREKIAAETQILTFSPEDSGKDNSDRDS